MFSDVVDEINEAFVDSIDSKLKGGGQLLLSHMMRSGADTWDDVSEWLGVNVLMAMAVITSRASSRIFVGLPLCRCNKPARSCSVVLIKISGRNEEYLRIIRQFTLDVWRAQYILSWFPKPMKRIIGPFLPWARRATRQASVHLRPMIDARQNKLKVKGESSSDKPVCWLYFRRALTRPLTRKTE